MSRLSWTRLAVNDTVTVARHEGRTLITDRYSLWDVNALSDLMKRVPDTDFGHYTMKGRKFTTDKDGFSRKDAAGLAALFDGLAAEFDSAPEATLTGWSVDGYRIVVTRDGRALRIKGRVAETIDGRMALRAVDAERKPIGVFLPTTGGPGETIWRFVGAVQPLINDRYYAPVLEVIASLAVDEMQRLEESRAAAQSA
ncbi:MULTISPECIES: hypothetical protein [Glycomyces]|uniref:DUF4429 domain-containing protein n=2 Tax=Glycomyces TaxID=58113 RepID=A0ABU2AHV9_9ACTN|nr:hypothetical protein [Glycomyces lechevalierae]MDR7336797.1 hypothetical protein [Glycomyces lechevalierae]